MLVAILKAFGAPTPIIKVREAAIKALPSCDPLVWAACVHHLRVNGLLVVNLADGTWAPGTGIEEIVTEGWPDGIAKRVLKALEGEGK